jgi:DNA-binding LacI/PurR family transcriptional regulator
MKKSSVLKEIATELGVSINTVSRALRDCSDISEKTKEKVRKKAIELGYIQNTLSRLLDDEGKELIAVIIKSFENLYYTSFVQSFIDQSARSNYTYMVLPTDKYSIDVNNYSNISELIYDIEECLNDSYEELDDLEWVSQTISEYNYYNNTNK